MKALVLDAEWTPRASYRPSERERSERRAENCSQVYQNPKVQLLDVPVPEIQGDEVLVRVRAAGVCGSDVHLVEFDCDGYMASGDPAKLPVTMGHESAGVVERVGPQVRDLRPGDPVALLPADLCHRCQACRTGYFNQCQNLEELGFSLNGGLAEYAKAREQQCFRVDRLLEQYGDEDRAFDAAAMLEPFGVLFNAMFVRAGGFLPGSNVVVIGAGPIGLIAVALARAAGAGKVIVLETLEARRTLAELLGADRALDPLALSRDRLDTADVLLELTRGDGVHMAVEAAGASPRTLPPLERCLAIGGKIVQVGIGVAPTPLQLVRLQTIAASLHGGMGSASATYAGIRLMASGRLDLTPIVTARYPLARAAEALSRMGERHDGKVMVRP